MTDHDTESDHNRPWVKRITILVAVWLAVWIFTAWLQMHPQPLGLLAALGALFAVGWWAHDRDSAWDPVEWSGNPVGRRLKSSQDSRISYLRRLMDDAIAPGTRGEPNASAVSLQALVRDVAVDRLRGRATAAGAAQLPDDAELLAHSDPALAAYLLAQPPPPITRQTVTDIIDRIEAL